MTEEEQHKLQTLAGSTALMLLLKHVIGMVYFDEDADVFRKRLAALDATVVDEINRTSFSNRDDATAYARETASTIVTNTLAAITHRDER